MRDLLSYKQPAKAYQTRTSKERKREWWAKDVKFMESFEYRKNIQSLLER